MPYFTGQTLSHSPPEVNNFFTLVRYTVKTVWHVVLTVHFILSTTGVIL